MVSTLPTIGFNLETVEYRNIKFTVWDIGGQDKLRPLWKHYFSGIHGVIFVVDSSDSTRIDEASEEINKIISETDLEGASVLIYANKQDLPGALKPNDLVNKLGLHSYRSRKWYLMPTCATTGEGLHEGLEWLSTSIKS